MSGFMRSISRLRWYVLTLALMAGAVIVGGILLYEWNEERQAQAAMQMGSKIVSAIYAFRGTEGEFPPTLDDLVPQYITTIPMPLWGNRKWEYSRYEDSQGFELTISHGPDGHPTIGFSYEAGVGGGWLYNW